MIESTAGQLWWYFLIVWIFDRHEGGRVKNVGEFQTSRGRVYKRVNVVKYFEGANKPIDPDSCVQSWDKI